MPRDRGFTLLELLLTIVLLSFAMAIAIPPVSQSILRSSVNADSKQLLHMVKLARQSAVFSGERVVVCTVDASMRCTRGWSEDLLVFTDTNRNNRLDQADRLVQYWNQDTRHSRIKWQGFGPGFLRFRESGYAAENGAFTLCPANGDIRYARHLVVNRVGRAYISRDRNGDGIADYGNNKMPAC